MQTTTDPKQTILEISKNNSEPSWLLEKRQKALKLFQDTPMPSFIYGLNINLKIDLNLSDLDITKSKEIKKEIINNNQDVKIYNLNEALEYIPELLKEYFMEKIIPANDKFTSFHQALVNNVLIMHIPKNTVAKDPIEITSIISSETNFDHLIVIAEDNSEITIFEDLKSENEEESYISKLVEVSLGNNAKVNYSNLQTLNKNTFLFTKKRAITKRDSTMNWLDCCFGSETTSSEITSNLDGEGSEAKNYGIFFGDDNQQFDLVVNSIHNAPNTSSDIFSKGALTDSSKCIYHGLVKIKQNAPGSNGYQKADTILLSPNAIADAIPDLEIDNSDVKCSHGATIGKIDEEKLFYLRTRGFDKNAATKIYIKGFFNQLIKNMESKKLRESMDILMDDKMKNIKTEDNKKTNINFKKDFPIFDNHPDLVYLDSGATSQRPKQVIKKITDFYERENANIHRGVYTLSEEATEKYNLARKKVADFINANQNEIIFTRNTTESLNLLANTIKPLIKKGKDEILLSEMEHHSNLVPWQQFARDNNMKLKFIPLTDNYELDYKKAKELISDKTAVLSVTHISNVLGSINDIKQLIDLAKEKQALTIIDAAQSVQHMKIDVKELDCDFLAFSSHKMLGPTGIGVLYGKANHLKLMKPFLLGGGMINSVSYQEATYAEIPEKFEAGTQNIAEAIALGEAIKYIEQIGFKKIQEHEKELTEYALEQLNTISNIEIYNPGKEKSSPVISFNLKDIHPHDVATILNDNNIAVRAGHHCCMPLMKKLGIQGTCRASFSIYNNREDIDKLIVALKKCIEVFH
jgi:cysteine desulfurase/selenocysteine lyase